MAEQYLVRLTAPMPARRKVFRAGVGLFLSVWWGTALCSGYRAIWQVSSVEVSASDAVLRPGSTVRARIVTSGRTHARLNVALVQGGRSETLTSLYVPASRHSKTDPRGHRPHAARPLRLPPRPRHAPRRGSGQLAVPPHSSTQDPRRSRADRRQPCRAA